MTLIICVVSKARARGKTALVERLTSRFSSEGFSVATVKHTSGSFDTAKKDTWRHLEAGAVVTVASTPNEIVVITRRKKPSLEKALDAIHVEPELILVEGYKRFSYPKILCADTAEEGQAIIKQISNVVMVSGRISGSVKEKERFQTKFPDIPVYDFEEMVSALKGMLVKSILGSLPGLNCKHCGYDSCLDLAKAIIGGEATKKDCEVLAMNITTLKVDGKNIPIGKFPQQIIRNLVMAVLDTLKGVGKHPQYVEITVKAPEKNHN